MPPEKVEEKDKPIEYPVQDLSVLRGITWRAQNSCSEPMEIENYFELDKKRPHLVQLIDAVSKYFHVPALLIRTTLYAESRFQHAVAGDTHLEGGSVGIGQFRPGTWAEIRKEAGFRQFMKNSYGMYKFERGENILADIAACAQLIKNIAARFEINLNRPPSLVEVLTIRARYTGWKNIPKIVENYKNKRSIPKALQEFLAKYELFSSQIVEDRKKKERQSMGDDMCNWMMNV